MTISRIPDTTQTVYAELLDQLRAAPLMPRSGSFVSKTIGGATYWYVQRVDAGRKRQIYLGRETPDLLTRIDNARQTAAATAEDERRRRELVAMCVAGGMAVESPAAGSVLRVLEDAGLFRSGAVLVGTQALACIGNLMGVRLDAQTLRTADVDIAIRVGVSDMRTDILETLRDADPRFIAVPELDSRDPSTSFRIRGRDLRVDLLVPAARESSRPVYLPHLNAAAQRLRGLGYLVHERVEAVVLASSGILVNVPSPARFAIHKLWVAGQRNVSEQTKARKDIRQAAELLEVLRDDRPADLERAWSALPEAMRRVVRRSAAQLDAALRVSIGELVGDAFGRSRV